MSNINDGGPAFPQGHPELCKVGQSVDKTQGMTLRDWFAGQALAGLCSGNLPFCPDQVSMTAYGYADAMIAAREVRNGN